jgi:dephospho-CoA kinase
MIIGLTGRIASGKGVIKDFLQEKGFKYLTLSDVVREEAAQRGIPIERSSLQELGNEVRKKEGAGSWMRRLIKKIQPGFDYVIDGIRNPGEVDELRKIPGFYLIAVDAPQETRFKRFLSRAKPSDPKTWEEFLEIDNRDFGEEDPLGQQVGKCMEMGNFKLINDSILEKFQKKIEMIFNKIQKSGYV